MLKKNWNPGDLFALTNAAQSFCALKTAVELDIFTLLDRDDIDGLTSTEIARLTECDPRAMDMLTAALVALNLLERRADRLVAGDSARRFLSLKSDGYCGFILKHVGDILPDWLELTGCVRSGRPGRLTMTDEGERERENFLMGMFNVARLQAEAVARALDLQGRKKLLDIGGGPGTYSIFFCRQYPQLRATLLDLPASGNIAQRNIESYGLGERITFLGGSYYEELPQGFDVVWISQVLHSENPETCHDLIRRAAASLEPGGLLAVQEFLLDEDRSGPVASTLFALNMLVETEGGQAYTESEITNMMEAAGCLSIKRIKADTPPHCGILAGIKG